MSYQHIRLPDSGEKISVKDGRLNIPDQPIIGYVEGDGIGPDITRAMLRVLDASVEKAYDGKRQIHWCELYLGEKAGSLYDGDYFPAETLAAIRDHCGYQRSTNHTSGWGLSLTECLTATGVGPLCLCTPGALLHRRTLTDARA